MSICSLGSSFRYGTGYSPKASPSGSGSDQLGPDRHQMLCGLFYSATEHAAPALICSYYFFMIRIFVNVAMNSKKLHFVPCFFNLPVLYIAFGAEA
jgi:hypothetical protein